MVIFDTVQIILYLVIFFLLCGSISSLVIGMDLTFHGVQPAPVGRWRFSPVAWAAVANFFSFFSLLVYLRYRPQILKIYPGKSYVFRREMLGILMCSFIPLAIAGFLLVWLPVDRCNTPERLQGLERALNRPSNHITFVRAKFAALEKINPLNHEQLCRALVEIEWEGKPREDNYPMWFRVVRFGDGWGSGVTTELQENEPAYQLRKM